MSRSTERRKKKKCNKGNKLSMDKVLMNEARESFLKDTKMTQPVKLTKRTTKSISTFAAGISMQKARTIAVCTYRSMLTA